MGMWQDSAFATLHAGTLSVYGQAVAYTPASTGVPENIQAVYDANAAVLDMQDGVQVQATAPVIDVRVSDLTTRPKRGDTLTVAGIAYRVVKVEADATGWASLRLAE